MSFTVFLGNLPVWVTADDIKGWLTAEDLVSDSIKVIRNHETQESKGFAFVEAPTSDEMQAIIRRFDRAPLEDRLLRANPAQPTKPKGVANGAAAAAGSMPERAPRRDMKPKRASKPSPPRNNNRILPRALSPPNSPRRCSPTAFHNTCELLTTPCIVQQLALFQLVACGPWIANSSPMKLLLVGALLVGACSISPAQITPVVNVNARYIVEGIEVAGSDEFTLSRGIHEEIQSMIGENLDQPALDALKYRIRKELHARSVEYVIKRGDQPEQVRVSFEVTRRSISFDVNVPKFLYHSTQGWSGVVEGVTNAGPNTFSFRVLSDADELLERAAGIAARYENHKVGSDRVALGFEFESYHQQWNRSTTDQDPDSLYRTRQNFEPMITIVLARPLTFSAGVSFERLQMQFPAARIESANAMVNTLRYHRLLEDSDAQKQVLDAGYSLRAATNLLSSDFVYARHRWNAAYTFSREHSQMQISFQAGLISGHAPLFERYVLGNSSTLRGWNKYDVDPLGGSRMAHGFD